tara:strand:+ start:270 stop:485 length:216 start_codon:yes stop_codon:yes gene_type:complete
MICYNCKGNGFVKLKFECEVAVTNCKVCKSQGEVQENEHYHQYWDDGNNNPNFYYGPPLDPEGFKNYKIYK